MKFEIHTLQSAPEGSRPVLAEVERAYGFIPNLLGVLAESPLAVAAYPQINQLLQSKSSLTPQEQQVALLTVSHENGCEYCMGAHCSLAAMAQTPPGIIQSLRDGIPPSDARAAALVKFTRTLVKQRGWVDDSVVAEFLAAGFTRGQVLDVLVILALKTLSNYTNHLAGTPLDEAFASQKWTRAT